MLTAMRRRALLAAYDGMLFEKFDERFGYEWRIAISGWSHNIRQRTFTALECAGLIKPGNCLVTRTGYSRTYNITEAGRRALQESGQP